MKKAIIALSIAFLVGMTGMASATQITFGLGAGGSVDYAGGGAALITIGGAVGSVDGGSIAFETLDFTTGGHLSGSASGGVTTEVFAGGGSLTIGSLFSATFVGNSTLTIESTTFGATGNFLGDLNITHLDSAIALANGWSLPPSGDGIITQVEFAFATAVPAPGAGFSATQFGGSVILTQVAAPVPEPASLILMGSGLIGLAFYGRRRSQNQV